MTRAVVDALFYAPTDAISDPDTARLVELRSRLIDVRKADVDPLDLVGTGAFSATQVAGKKRSLAGDAATNARATLLADMQRRMTRRTSLGGRGRGRAGIRQRFEATDLDQRRALVRGLLSVEVTPGGRGASRVRVTHLLATSLNDDSCELLGAPSSA